LHLSPEVFPTIVLASQAPIAKTNMTRHSPNNRDATLNMSRDGGLLFIVRTWRPGAVHEKSGVHVLLRQHTACVQLTSFTHSAPCSGAWTGLVQLTPA
jgi:hypothetical protein